MRFVLHDQQKDNDKDKDNDKGKDNDKDIVEAPLKVGSIRQPSNHYSTLVLHTMRFVVYNSMSLQLHYLYTSRRYKKNIYYIYWKLV